MTGRAVAAAVTGVAETVVGKKKGRERRRDVISEHLSAL